MSEDIVEQKNTTILKLTLILDKLFVVLEDFRQNLNHFQKSCKCSENLKNTSDFCELEVNYKTIVKEYDDCKSQIEEELNLNCDNTDLYIGDESADDSDVDKSESSRVRLPSDPNIFKLCLECEYKNCDYQTWSGKEMKRHVKAIHVNKCQIKCRKCVYRCWGPLRLRDHMKSCHSDLNKWLVCPYEDCHHQSCNKTNLTKHINVLHLNKEKISCKECGFKCWGLRNLQIHERTVHNHPVLLNGRLVIAAPNRKAFKCSQCLQIYRMSHKYRTKAQLMKHVEWFHKKKGENYYYKGCGFFGKSLSLVMQHSKTDHKRFASRPTPKFKCSAHCGISFDSFDELHKHLSKSHNLSNYGLKSMISENSAQNKTDYIINGVKSNSDESINESVDTTALSAFDNSDVQQFVNVVTEDISNDSSSHESNEKFVFGSNWLKQMREQMSDKQKESEDITSDKRQKSEPMNKTDSYGEVMNRRLTEIIEPLRCKWCKYKTHKSMALIDHIKLIHSGYQCEHCSDNFRNFEQYNQHLRNCSSSILVFDLEKTIINEVGHKQSHDNSSEVCPTIKSETQNSDVNPSVDITVSEGMNSNSSLIALKLSSDPSDSDQTTDKKYNCGYVGCYFQTILKHEFTTHIDLHSNEYQNKSKLYTKYCKKERLLCKMCPFKCWTQKILENHEHRMHSIHSSEALLNTDYIDIKIKTESQDKEIEDLPDFNNDSNIVSYGEPELRKDVINVNRLNKSVLTFEPTFQKNSPRVESSGKSQFNYRRGTYVYYCSECEFKIRGKKTYKKHLKDLHNMYICGLCQILCRGSDGLALHRSEYHSTVDNRFKCEAKKCKFKCCDSRVFAEHKKLHFYENLDRIVTEFQSGINRVQIKREVEEEDTHFVNAQQFLVQTREQTIKATSQSCLEINKLSNQPIVCPQESAPVISEPSLNTGKRLRGLNSARVPINFVKKSTKKISELFKK